MVKLERTTVVSIILGAIFIVVVSLFVSAEYVFGQASGQTTFTTPVYITDSASVSGTLAKGSGTFVIDHPLYPEDKLLYHSFVESPDVKNIYDGVVELNAAGRATIELPEYFEALNTDYRYQVKGIDAPAPNLHIEREIANNTFTIAGGPPNAKVSWQVTGIRQDPYILANPIINEVEKGPEALVDKGEYLWSGYEGEAETQRGWWQRILDWFKRLWE